MKIRYINLGEINGIQVAAEHELTKNTEPLSPFVVAYTVGETVLTMTGYYPPSKYLKVENIPSDVKLVRIYTQRGSVAGSLLLDQNVLFVHLHIKIANLLGTIWEVVNINLMDSIIGALAEQEVVTQKSTHKEHSNDVVIVEDGREKKVAGIWATHIYRKGWVTLGMCVILEPNYDLFEQVFRVDTGKMAVKEVVGVRDAVAGVNSEQNKVDKDILARTIAEKLVSSLGHTIQDGKFTLAEQNAMLSISDVLSSEDWIQKGIRPIECLEEKPHEFPIEDV